VLPGTSGLVHRDPRGEKAATSGGKQGRRAKMPIKCRRGENSSNQQACASNG